MNRNTPPKRGMLQRIRKACEITPSRLLKAVFQRVPVCSLKKVRMTA